MAEKTEPPSGRKISEARSQGQVAMSRELNAAIALLMGVWLLRNNGMNLYQALSEVTVSTLVALPKAEATSAWIVGFLVSSFLRVMPTLLQIMVWLLVTGMIVTVAQTGLLWASKRIGFDFSRLNIINGFKRFVSPQGLLELGKALLKLVVVGWVAYAFLQEHALEMLGLAQIDYPIALGHWVTLGLDMAWRVGSIYLILAIADYIYQRWHYMQMMKMTKEEVKEEYKQQEGDPVIKGRIRSKQRTMVRRRMMANVPKADVIITNPTHLAVAVQYKQGEMEAPVVLAKGAYKIAERIVEIARENHIPVIQNIPVARALYKKVEIDQEIPSDLYVALAEILAYVYRLKQPVPAAGS